MTGAISELIPVGIVGFVIMLVSATYCVATLRGHAPTNAAGSAETDISVESHRPVRRQRSNAGFMERMEQRWRRRRDEGHEG